MKNLGKELKPTLQKKVLSDKYTGLYYGQSGEDTVLWRMLKSKRHGFYVDIGAHHPRKFSNTYLLHRFRQWSGVNIDATQSAIDAFNVERPKDINICSAVSLTCGDVQLRVTSGGARNTISDEQAAAVKANGVDIHEIRTIPSAPLADILNEALPAGRAIDLMNIDVEGKDLEVLESNDWARYRPSVIVIEDLEFRAYPMATPIAAFMRQAGYDMASHLFDTTIYALRA